MKKFFIPALFALALTACGENKEKAETTDVQAAASTDGTAYTVDSTSTVTWKGSKPTGSHDGTFKVKEGSLSVKDNMLTGGSFLIDIASLTNTDLASDPDSKGKLEGHLKSPDFFDVAKYPTARFEITSIVPNTDSANKTATHIVKGNLTLRDSTKNVSFPAKVTVDAQSVSATADLTIDRTDWGMSYKGPNNPQDWVISKSVDIKINLAATKK